MKEAIRKELRSKRKSITEIDRERKSHRIFNTLLKQPEFIDAKKILVYLSIDEEVVTHFMVQRLLTGNKEIFAPKMVQEQLLICKIDHWEDLEPGSHHVLEPCETVEIAHPSEIDLIIVPGVAFSPDGARMGRGKGYYDRLLAHTRGTKVALAYQEQILQALPIEAHDVPMDIIITDETIYRP